MRFIVGNKTSQTINLVQWVSQLENGFRNITLLLSRLFQPGSMTMQFNRFTRFVRF